MSEAKFKEFWIHNFYVKETTSWAINSIEFNKYENTHDIPDILPEEHRIHVIEYSAIEAKDKEIARLKAELAEKDEVLSEIAKQGYGYQGYWEEDDYEGLAEHATREHLRNQDKAREILQKYRGDK